MPITTGRVWTMASSRMFVVLTLGLPAPAQADWMIGGYFGATHTMTGTMSVTQPTLDTNLVLDGVKFRGRSFQSPVYYGYRVSHNLPFKRAFSVEAEFVHAKVYAETEHEVSITGRRNGVAVDGREPMDQSVEALSISHGLNLILFNFVARLPVTSSASRWQFTVRLGAGPTLPHAESTIGGRHREQYEWGALAAHAAGGVEMRMAHRLSVLGEYKFSRTREAVSVPEGKAQVLLRTYHGVIGLGYRF